MKKLKLIIPILIFILTSFFVLYLIFNKQNNNASVDVNNKIKSYYNSPIIPEGFSKLETSTASWQFDENGIPKGWNNGLVIQDNIGNEFVWVPVKDINYDEILKNWWDYWRFNEIDPKTKEQVKEYGGFYIARYEAGISDNMQNNLTNISETSNNIIEIPVSKKDRLPWNYITLKNAKANAQSMYESNNSIDSDLMSVFHWFYIIRWLTDTGYDINTANQFGNFVDSKFSFTGYYSIDYNKDYEYNSYEYTENKTKQTYNMILSTGASDTTKTNNIYDLAGNLIEFTDTFSEDMGYYSVGGYFGQLSEHFSIYPSNIGDKTPLEKLGFRVVLYLK